MAYTLNASEIRAPHEINESNNSQVAVQRTLNGSINRDYFGDNKRFWLLSYRNVTKTDYDTIKAFHTTYLSTGTTVAFASDETNYTIASTQCHIDINERGFTIRGATYISDFDVILTEA